ncbi:hypothetical protein DFQ27_003734 [Actinomortierella ambigua]|uniref:Uncharacterized protein n=1 Tax=Actinomortierella ambigua TaxID=1343610 RepID=A0A9P6Q551_9FUNG|nr:hypothetical protein DFQ27_003734 [Actinomortierella ambigua]
MYVPSPKGRDWKRQTQVQRERRREFDMSTNYILPAMGIHTSEDPDLREIILGGLRLGVLDKLSFA